MDPRTVVRETGRGNAAPEAGIRFDKSIRALLSVSFPGKDDNSETVPSGELRNTESLTLSVRCGPDHGVTGNNHLNTAVPGKPISDFPVVAKVINGQVRIFSRLNAAFAGLQA